MLTDAEKEINELRGYLIGTDWYVIRKMEKGTEIPAEIVSKREAARIRISELENS